MKRAEDPKRLTRKQRALLAILMTGNVNEQGVRISWCDTEQIMERAWGTCRESVIAALRRLQIKKLVEHRPMAETRRDRRRTIYVPTNLAFDLWGDETAEPSGSNSLLDFHISEATLKTVLRGEAAK